MPTSVSWSRLAAPRGFINPASLRAPIPDGLTVADDGTVVLFGEHYRPEADIAPGTPVVVARDSRGNLTVAPKSDVERSVAEQEAVRAARAVAAEAEREANRAVNRALNVPVTWTPDSNPFMSSHWGGAHSPASKRGAVVHIRLAEDLHEGRLHRSKGDYLCGRRSKWGDLHPVDEPAQVGASAQRVTCRSCLRVSDRWSGRTHET